MEPTNLIGSLGRGRGHSSAWYHALQLRLRVFSPFRGLYTSCCSYLGCTYLAENANLSALRTLGCLFCSYVYSGGSTIYLPYPASPAWMDSFLFRILALCWMQIRLLKSAGTELGMPELLVDCRTQGRERKQETKVLKTFGELCCSAWEYGREKMVASKGVLIALKNLTLPVSHVHGCLREESLVFFLWARLDCADTRDVPCKKFARWKAAAVVVPVCWRCVCVFLSEGMKANTELALSSLLWFRSVSGLIVR